MNFVDHPEHDGHEKVVVLNDSASGLRAIIAIHSTTLGPAAGGCRIWKYQSEEDALGDALRLSRGMTFKNAIAGLDLGGGKAVVMLKDGQEKTNDLMLAFGRAVEELKGSYYTAEDVGSTTEDMEVIHTQTSFVAGLSNGKYASGNPSPVTARVVFEGIKCACANMITGGDLSGVRVAVQGVGHVGWNLCERLHNAGALLTVSDVNPTRCEAAAERFNAQIGDIDRFHAAECDVYAPCALGGTLNRRSIPEIRAKIVAGAANNQLESEADADLLYQAGVLYMPDFLVNAGGILNVAAEIRKIEDKGWVEERISILLQRMQNVLDQSKLAGTSPHHVAMRMARDRISPAEHMFPE